MVSVRLNEEMNNQLDHLAFLTRRSKSSFIIEALEMYLEDIEDINISMKRATSPKRNLINSEKLKEELGLGE